MIQAEKAHARMRADMDRKKVEKQGTEIAQSEMLGSRIIFEQEEEDGFTVLAPYASRSPFEVWIMPKKHVSRIEESLIENEEKEKLNWGVVGLLAEILSKTLLKLHGSLGDPGYSMLVQNAPFAWVGYGHLYKHYHWRIIIETHRLASPAGYEHLTGIWSNVVSPEDACHQLTS
jgi:UDPglucose--hexose-1-phosphate uridylyltransferase